MHQFCAGKIPSQIDLAFHKAVDKILCTTQISAGSFTSHDVLFGSYQINFDTAINHNLKYIRNFSKIDPKSLQISASKLDFNMIYDLVNPDDQVEYLSTLLKTRTVDHLGSLENFKMSLICETFITELSSLKLTYLRIKMNIS